MEVVKSYMICFNFLVGLGIVYFRVRWKLFVILFVGGQCDNFYIRRGLLFAQ